MKRSFLVLFLLGLLNFSARGVAGDTTWVQAHSTVRLTHTGNFDTAVTFPAAGTTTYRNIYMIVTLGKYVCGTSVCGDWDYTFQTYLKTPDPSGEIFELGRLITPYANVSGPRTPFTWTQRYVYDVTDYASKLQGSDTIRINYSGYTWGFTADIKFAFVEGTPDRNVTGIQRLWHGSFSYGTTPAINTHFPADTFTAPSGTSSTVVKFTVTGHGSDSTNQCCEFMSHNYDVMLNGSSAATHTIWKSCGLGELYPQTGTWPLDRANWCPGEQTQSHNTVLPGITGGTTFNTAIQFEPYTSPGPGAYGYGSYTTEGTLIYYGDFNKTLDASIDDIISPTNDNNHFRENPICSTPRIKVKNHGSATIASMQIEYGLEGSTLATYSWSGPLAPLAETEIVLPDLSDLHALAGTTLLNTFVARITSVNGTADEDNTNDQLKSQFTPSPKWDSVFYIDFKSNNEATTPGGTMSETKWEIFDANGTVVASRTNAAINTAYKDTVYLPTGCYKLQITDGSCDGLHWFLWDQYPSYGVNAGSLVVRKANGVAIPMHGYYYSGVYHDDFGCGYTQYFQTHTADNAITEISAGQVGLEAYPNPAKNSVNVNIAGVTYINGTLQVIDAVGRIVLQTSCTSASAVLNTESLVNGIYTVQFINANGNKLHTRLLIAK